MGKAARKMKKKQVQAETAQSRQANARWETLLAEQMKAGKYAEAIETLAELVKGDDIKPEFMYDAAYAYFMVGDYERAGQWINHTLSYAPGHIPVRILLARLLILQERQDDGLAVFDFVLDKGADTLTEAQRDEIEEIVEFYGRSEGEKIRRSYPHIAARGDKGREPDFGEPAAEGSRRRSGGWRGRRRSCGCGEAHGRGWGRGGRGSCGGSQAGTRSKGGCRREETGRYFSQP